MHEALQELMHAFITGEPNPGRALLEILREHFIDGSNVISFLDELVAGSMNRRRTQSNISKTQSPGLSNRIQKDPASRDAPLRAFSLAIDGWSSLVLGVIHLIRQAKGGPRSHQPTSSHR